VYFEIGDKAELRFIISKECLKDPFCFCSVGGRQEGQEGQGGVCGSDDGGQSVGQKREMQRGHFEL
jgi:hypothetical protein